MFDLKGADGNAIVRVHNAVVDLGDIVLIFGAIVAPVVEAIIAPDVDALFGKRATLKAREWGAAKVDIGIESIAQMAHDLSSCNWRIGTGPGTPNAKRRRVAIKPAHNIERGQVRNVVGVEMGQKHFIDGDIRIRGVRTALVEAVDNARATVEQ